MLLSWRLLTHGLPDFGLLVERLTLRDLPDDLSRRASLRRRDRDQPRKARLSPPPHRRGSRSLHVCIENVDQSGGCLYGYACVYMDTISWASATQPLRMIRDPRLAFDQLFGSGGSPEKRAARRQAQRSILDWIPNEVARLKGTLGLSDRSRLDAYLENIREIERRIEKVEERNQSGELRELPNAPRGVPDSYGDHVEIMFDLMTLAFMADMTRVVSLKMSRDVSGRSFPESGVYEGFHNASHHRNQEPNVVKLSKINRYHVSLVPYLLKKLQDAEENGSNLLEKSLILYGSPMGDPNIHNHKRVPLFLAGHANGQLPGNLHIKAADQTPTANAMLSLLHMLGLDDRDAFGDSTEPLDLTSVPVRSAPPPIWPMDPFSACSHSRRRAIFS